MTTRPGSTPGDGGHRDHRRYDAYARHHAEHGDSVLIPAATVVVVRDGEAGVETLMLRKNSKIAFGGMWVFPGGKIDTADQVVGDDGATDELATAAAAAVREAAEEASVAVDPVSDSRDPRQLLDVHVQERARPRSLVAYHRFRRRQLRESVETQPSHLCHHR